ncbi:MAG: CBS domain-containing protein [Candidatus Aenigmarchaeota archaeon]|nr:CBS domain-containing protein [Candidatus Aenigmarchaeota archaeon]
MQTIVRDVMTESPVCIDFNSTMAQAASLMQTNRVHELIVVRNGELAGMLSCRSIVGRSVKSEQKLSGSVFIPPTIGPEEKIDTAVEMLLFCGSRDLPVLSGRKLVGVVSEIDVIKTLTNNRTARDVMRPIKFYTSENDPASGAREKIIKHNINRLPVLSKDGKLKGMLSTLDLLDIVFPQKGQRVGNISGEKITGTKVGNLMETNIFTVKPDEKINSVVNVIKENRISSLIVIDDGRAVGIITPKCLLSLMMPLKDVSTNVVITGLSDYNMENKLAVDRLVRKSLSRMERLTETISITLDFKEHRKQENKGKTNFEIKARIKTANGNFFATSSGWILAQVVNDVLDGLEREIKKKIGKGV